MIANTLKTVKGRGEGRERERGTLSNLPGSDGPVQSVFTSYVVGI